MRSPADCHPDRPAVGRGLCAHCYRQARHAGTLRQHGRRPTRPGDCIRLAADTYIVSCPVIIGRGRSPAAIAGRRHAARLMRQAGMTVTDIGWYLDGRDHSTITKLLEQPDPEAPDADPPTFETCQVDGCTNDAYHMHMCTGHRMRWVRQGSVDAELPLRAIRPDDAPTLDLEVHDRRGYQAGCRCEVCRRDAVMAVKLNRHDPQSIPVDVGAAAVERLRRQGMSVPQISKASGVGTATIYKWLKGSVDVCFRSTVAKIEGVVPPAREPEPDPECVDCGGPPMPGGAVRCLPCFQSWSRARAS